MSAGQRPDGGVLLAEDIPAKGGPRSFDQPNISYEALALSPIPLNYITNTCSRQEVLEKF